MVSEGQPRSSGRAKSYRDLVAWQKAMELVRAVYSATKEWPADEKYALTSQIRRAVVSIPANIAEGQGRLGERELLHHLSIAHGSLCEVETHLMIGHEQHFLNRQDFTSVMRQAAEVGRILRGLIDSLRRP